MTSRQLLAILRDHVYGPAQPHPCMSGRRACGCDPPTARYCLVALPLAVEFAEARADEVRSARLALREAGR